MFSKKTSTLLLFYSVIPSRKSPGCSLYKGKNLLAFHSVPPMLLISLPLQFCITDFGQSLKKTLSMTKKKNLKSFLCK